MARYRRKERWRWNRVRHLSVGQSGYIRCDRYSWFAYSISSHRQCEANGASGFDYEFNSIEDETNELFCAYREMFELAVSQQQNPVRELLRIYFPITDVLFVSERR